MLCIVLFIITVLSVSMICIKFTHDLEGYFTGIRETWVWFCYWSFCFACIIYASSMQVVPLPRCLFFHLLPWWRHQMKTFSALLALCPGNSLVTGEFPSQRPVTRSFDVYLVCAWISRWVSNREVGDLRRHLSHYDVNVMHILQGCFMTFCLTSDHYGFGQNRPFLKHNKKKQSTELDKCWRHTVNIQF